MAFPNNYEDLLFWNPINRTWHRIFLHSVYPWIHHERQSLNAISDYRLVGSDWSFLICYHYLCVFRLTAFSMGFDICSYESRAGHEQRILK